MAASEEENANLDIPSHRDVENKLTVVVISDTHNHHDLFESIPDGDVLIHCGDFSENGSIEETENFATWFSEQSHPHKLLISGNHDVSAKKDFLAALKQRKEGGDAKPKKKITSFSGRYATHFFSEEKNGIKFLYNETVVIDGVNFYGTDWNKRGAKIPTDTNILLTHEPPLGILDFTSTNENIGSEQLKNDLEKCPNLWVHVFGHVHLARGVQANEGEPVFINAASVNKRFGNLSDEVKPPFVFQI